MENNINTIQNLADAIIALNTSDRMNLVAALSEKSGVPIVTATQQEHTPQSRLPVFGTRPTEFQLGNLLLEMGAPSSNKGFKYLVTGILMCVDNPANIDQLTTVLYPDIAKAHSTTPSRVERAIRHEIECIYDTPNIAEVLTDLGVTLFASAYKGKPTNGEFVAGMARLFNK